MSFDINETIFAAQGQYLEEQASRYEETLMEQFAASPEGQALVEAGTELGWAAVMVHYGITALGITPPTMTVSDLEEILFALFPRKVITEKGDGAEIIQEVRAFWQFVERVYQLPQARQLLELMTPEATRRLERALQKPTNFGMAKSFVLLGKQAGFDMESPEGMRAWVEAYNATLAPAKAAGERGSKPKGRSSRSTPRRRKKHLPPQ